MASYPRHGIAGEGVSLAKKVLTFATLGIFAKLLQLDLGNLQMLGLSIQSKDPYLVPGFLGLCLFYTYIALLVSRGEAAMDNATDKKVIEGFEEWQKSKVRVAFSVLSLPFSMFVYCMPYAMGALGIFLLWQDSIAVIVAVWRAASA